MDRLDALESYSDLRPFVAGEAFTQAMNFLAWHNRQKMTGMMDVWQGLVVAMAFQQSAIDRSQYPTVRSFFREYSKGPPATVEACRSIADKLRKYLLSAG